ncbi:MAG: hypothetical protein KatS3mg070_1019 [Meiothermus sp.]|uniref:hypothetical protein n=1 Tax=Meiothermus sp. TaxID=1955249 RepID=UPI0021DE052A|nr:hypothetical protein [Meiothermus sp.]GIW27656.1 MAG: hypothetical protein KatS3mg070_1019 [Meiothermus sp.]
MRSNPLNVQFWLWGQDVLAGHLEAFGFRRCPNASGQGSSLYRKGPVGLHSSTAWLGIAQGVLVYKRPVEGFFLLEDDQSMPLLPEQARPVDRVWGLEVLRSFVLGYEAWILRHAGPAYRKMLMENLPPMLRRDRASWEGWVSTDGCSTLFSAGHCRCSKK